MGCDIHLFVEARETSESPWHPVVVKTPCIYCKGTGSIDRPDPKCFWCDGTGSEVGYNHRNYDTFAMLANVRNGRGFAGIPTGEGFQPISEPRGLPKDLSKELRSIRGYSEEYKKLYGSGDFGDHSMSWLTLRELNEYDVTQETTKYGVVDPFQFKLFLDAGEPSSYCGMVSGKTVRMISPQAMKAFLECCHFDDQGGVHEVVLSPSATELLREKLSEEDLSDLCAPRTKVLNMFGTRISLHTQVGWRGTYKKASGVFFNEFLTALNQVGHPDNVRIVFGFDS